MIGATQRFDNSGLLNSVLSHGRISFSVDLFGAVGDGEDTADGGSSAREDDEMMEGKAFSCARNEKAASDSICSGAVLEKLLNPCNTGGVISRAFAGCSISISGVEGSGVALVGG